MTSRIALPYLVIVSICFVGCRVHVPVEYHAAARISGLLVPCYVLVLVICVGEVVLKSLSGSGPFISHTKQVTFGQTCDGGC